MHPYTPIVQNTEIVDRDYTIHAGREITLIKDGDGFWGWQIGTHTMLPMFRHRSICRDDAVRHIDGRQR
jgi:hypothetical protein